MGPAHCLHSSGRGRRLLCAAGSLCISIRWSPPARQNRPIIRIRRSTIRNWASTSVNRDAKHSSKTGLDALFLPDSVAIIGATERPGTVGRTILENLLHPSFQGKVYAVNSRHPEICGLKAYPRIGDVPEKVDLAVVATPARHGSRHHRRMRRCRREIGSCDLRGISRKRSGRRRTGTADSGAIAARRHAPDWSQLPGRS